MSDGPMPAPVRPGRRILLIAFVALLLFGASCYGYYRYRYPFGWSHSCDKQLSFALMMYADNYNGRFPSGEATPEASLSLLHRHSSEISGRLLGGKTVDASQVEEILARGELLGPDTCDWHYVPGLNQQSNPPIALFWDKPGLGHNGERLPGGGHVVWFTNGDRRHVAADEWDGFIVEQEELRQKLAE